MPSIQNAVLLTHIQNLQDDLEAARGELGGLARRQEEFCSAHEIRLQALEKETALAHQCLDCSAARLEQLALTLEKTVKIVDGLALQARLVGGIGALLGASILALLWALLTGQAGITFYP
jgi:hypothetical protein